MKLVVSMSVSLVVPSTTRIACSALCPASAAPFPDTAHDFNTVQ